jgi:hypothetical protein
MFSPTYLCNLKINGIIPLPNIEQLRGITLTYKKQLHPWGIVRLLPDFQKTMVGRFRRRNDAEAHLLILKQMIPKITYEIVFDPTGTFEESQKPNLVNSELVNSEPELVEV